MCVGPVFNVYIKKLIIDSVPVYVQVVRRQSLRRKSTLSSLLFGEDEAEALKSKNIKQTELVAALREAIARTAEHFHCLDPHHSSTVSSYTAAHGESGSDMFKSVC